jgi:hypothetical protein
VLRPDDPILSYSVIKSIHNPGRNSQTPGHHSGEDEVLNQNKDRHFYRVLSALRRGTYLWYWPRQRRIPLLLATHYSIILFNLMAKLAHEISFTDPQQKETLQRSMEAFVDDTDVAINDAEYPHISRICANSTD